MITNVGVRTYRPRQMGSLQDTRRVRTGSSSRLSVPVWRFLVIACLAMLVIGLVTTQYFYGRMMEMRMQAEKLQSAHQRISSQLKELNSEKELMASQQQIAALANRKLQLFVPGSQQVRHMRM